MWLDVSSEYNNNDLLFSDNLYLRVQFYIFLFRGGAWINIVFFGQYEYILNNTSILVGALKGPQTHNFQDCAQNSLVSNTVIVAY